MYRGRTAPAGRASVGAPPGRSPASGAAHAARGTATRKALGGAGPRGGGCGGAGPRGGGCGAAGRAAPPHAVRAGSSAPNAAARSRRAGAVQRALYLRPRQARRVRRRIIVLARWAPACAWRADLTVLRCPPAWTRHALTFHRQAQFDRVVALARILVAR